MGKGDEKEGSTAPPGTLSTWQMSGVILGALAAGAALYGFVTAPVRDSARFEADTRAQLGQHATQIAELRQQGDTDRKAVADLREALVKGLNATSSETQSLRLEIADLTGEAKGLRGQMSLLLERTPRR